MQFKASLVSLAAFAGAALAQNPQGTIVENLLAVKNYNLSTLLGFATTADGVVATLNSTGTNYTLFAPTNAAFTTFTQQFPDLVKAVTSSNDTLKDVLLYHTVPNITYDPSKITDAKVFVRSANSKKDAIEVTNANNKVTLFFDQGNATVVDSIPSSNGIIHIVDHVLLPPRPAGDVLINAGIKKLFAVSQGNVGLLDAFTNLNDSTIFAPTDDAFNTITEFAAKNGLNLTDTILTNILKFHFAKGVYFSTDIVKAKAAKLDTLLDGQTITVAVNGDGVTAIGDGQVALQLPAAKVTKANVLVRGGVAHVIDSVLVPNITVANTTAPTVNGTDAAGNKSGASASVASKATVALAAVAGLIAMAL